MLGFGEAIAIVVAGAVLFAGPNKVRARVQETIKFVRQGVKNTAAAKPAATAGRSVPKEPAAPAPKEPAPKKGPGAGLHTYAGAARYRSPVSLDQRYGKPTISSYRAF